MDTKSSPHKVAVLGLWVKEDKEGESLVSLASALEAGRLVWCSFTAKGKATE